MMELIAPVFRSDAIGNDIEKQPRIQFMNTWAGAKQGYGIWKVQTDILRGHSRF